MRPPQRVWGAHQTAAKKFELALVFLEFAPVSLDLARVGLGDLELVGLELEPELLLQLC